MADNFTKFSFLIKNATKKEVAWLEEVLAFDFEDEQQRPFLLEMLHTSRGLESTFEYWPDFDHVLPDLTSRDPRARSLWVYAARAGIPGPLPFLSTPFFPNSGPRRLSVSAWPIRAARCGQTSSRGGLHRHRQRDLPNRRCRDQNVRGAGRSTTTAHQVGRSGHHHQAPEGEAAMPTVTVTDVVVTTRKVNCLPSVPAAVGV